MAVLRNGGVEASCSLLMTNETADWIRHYTSAIPDFIIPSATQSYSVSADQRMSQMERSIYTQVVAMVGQYNLSHNAASCILADTWSALGCGFLLGRNASGKEEATSTIDSFGKKRSTKMVKSLFLDLELQPLRTFSAAQRRVGIAQTSETLMHANCTNHECQHVFYAEGRAQKFIIGSTCLVCEVPPDGNNNIGLVPFPRMSLVEALERFFLVPGTEELCETAGLRNALQAERDDHLGFKVYCDAYSGSAWM
jgi:hypothetical protein